MSQTLTVGITTNYGKFLKRWEYQTTWPASWEICIQAMKQQLEPDMKQQSGSKLGKEYDKSLYCYPADLTYMQSISYKMPGWMKHKLESRLLGETSIISDMQISSVQSLSRVLLFVTPFTAALQASLSITNFQSLLRLMSIESVMPFIHLILCCPLLIRPSIFPSIRVFFNESVLHIRCPKYWSFSFSISPSQWIFRTGFL